jgi:hypothetical protein
MPICRVSSSQMATVSNWSCRGERDRWVDGICNRLWLSVTVCARPYTLIVPIVAKCHLVYAHPHSPCGQDMTLTICKCHHQQTLLCISVPLIRVGQLH